MNDAIVADTLSDTNPHGLQLDLQGIRKTFGETVALDNVSFAVRKGTIHTILGENGSGKSTLVKTLSGVLIPDRGTLQMDGVPLVKATPRKARNAGIATVFQEVLVAPNRTVVENALLGQDTPFTWKFPKAERAEMVLETLAELSEQSFHPNAPVGDLNLVQQHQVAIARALLLNPKLLVLDESTAALDISERDLLFAAIDRRVAQGMSVVFISHRMDEVMQLSDEVTVLRSGQKIQTLQKSELTEQRLLGLLNPDAARQEGDN